MDTRMLGAHVSIAGGTPLAIGRATNLDATACQIFVKSASQWRSKPISESEAAEFRRLREASAIRYVVAHSTYLVNLAGTDPANRERSIATLADELRRAGMLGLDGVVVHPGAHLGAGEDLGLARIARSLERVLDRVPPDCPPLLLENTAGQGSVLGYRIEQLATIRDLCAARERLGVCIDTCHAYAAGYDLAASRGVEDFLDQFDSLFGLKGLHCMHLNDSRHPLGSRKDRHANIGAGEIGSGAFEQIIASARLRQVPLVLETPAGDDGEGHSRDLELLRSFES
jgi:deoxyribonuclease-4